MLGKQGEELAMNKEILSVANGHDDAFETTFSL